jgi:short-subunit dehydrogenase
MTHAGSLPERYGRWALVAGASSGLGAATAMAAGARGFDVVLLARRPDRLEESAARVREAHGVQTSCIRADLADPDIERIVAEGVAGLDLGVLIYNAAAEPEGRFLDIPLEEHRENIAVNCWTPTVLCHRFGREMVERGRGAIVLVSSMAALQGIKMYASYGAAKAYELILGEGLWDELRDHGVDAMSYVVGATATENYQGASGAEAYGEAPSLRQQRILSPSTPTEVAERIFERLDGGPRQYSHDLDEAIALESGSLPRIDVVQAMGAVTSGLKRFQKVG